MRPSGPVHRRAVLQLLCLWLSACAGAGRSGRGESSSASTPPPPEIRALSVEAEAQLERQDSLLWKSWTQGQASNGLGQPPSAGSPYTLESLKKLDSHLRRVSSADDRRALLHLKAFAAGEYLARALAPETQAIANLE